MTEIFTQPYIIVLIIVVFAALALLGVQVKAEFPFVKFELFSKKEKCTDKVLDVYNFTRRKTEEIIAFKHNIIKNQLIFSDGVLNCIKRKCKTDDNITMDSVRMIIKIKLKENGIEYYNAAEFSNYVGDRIDEVRNYLKCNLKAEFKSFLDTPEFADEVASIFTHARTTAEHWNAKIKDVEKEIEDKLKSYGINL